MRRRSEDAGGSRDRLLAHFPTVATLAGDARARTSAIRSALRLAVMCLPDMVLLQPDGSVLALNGGKLLDKRMLPAPACGPRWRSQRYRLRVTSAVDCCTAQLAESAMFRSSLFPRDYAVIKTHVRAPTPARSPAAAAHAREHPTRAVRPPHPRGHGAGGG